RPAVPRRGHELRRHARHHLRQRGLSRGDRAPRVPALPRSRAELRRARPLRGNPGCDGTRSARCGPRGGVVAGVLRPMKRIFAIALVLAACTTSYDYDPASAGDPEGSDRAPRAKTSSQFLRGVYADLLNRTPEAYEFQLTLNGQQPGLKFNLDEESIIVG